MFNTSEKLLQTKSGNAVVVAMDHGILGVPKGFENPEVTLDKILGAKPDGLLIGRNFAHKFQGALRKYPELKIVITVDFLAFSTIPGIEGQEEIQGQLFDLEDVKDLNADAVKALLIFGRKDPKVLERNMKYVADLSKKTQKYGIPLVVEPVLWGEKIEESRKSDPQLIGHACRIAFELGADIIKAPYPGNQETFAKMVKNSPIPMLILGGSQMDTSEDILRAVKEATEAGARGVFFGRNIWQHKVPERMVSAIKKIVHKNGSVAEALKLISEKEK